MHLHVFSQQFLQTTRLNQGNLSCSHKLSWLPHFPHQRLVPVSYLNFTGISEHAHIMNGL